MRLVDKYGKVDKQVDKVENLNLSWLKSLTRLIRITSRATGKFLNTLGQENSALPFKKGEVSTNVDDNVAKNELL